MLHLMPLQRKCLHPYFNDWETEAGGARDPQTPYTGTQIEPPDTLLSFVKLFTTLKYFIYSFMVKCSSDPERFQRRGSWVRRAIQHDNRRRTEPSLNPGLPLTSNMILGILCLSFLSTEWESQSFLPYLPPRLVVKR